jgi:MFS family permease
LAGVVGAAAYVGLRVPVKAPTAPVFSARAALRALNERPTLRKLVLAQGFYGGGLIAATPLFAIVYIDRLGASLAEVGVGGTLGFLAATLSSYGWGAVADRSGPVLPLRLGSVLGVLALVLVASAPSVLLLWVAAVGLGVAGSAIEIGINASIVDETSLETRASALAGWNAITGARGLVVPFVAGGLVQFGVLSVTSTLIGCAVASSIGALMFAAVGRAGFDWFPRLVSIPSVGEPRPSAQV